MGGGGGGYGERGVKRRKSRGLLGGGVKLRGEVVKVPLPPTLIWRRFTPLKLPPNLTSSMGQFFWGGGA